MVGRCGAPADVERNYPDVMTAIPSRGAAGKAWAALPAPVRREALQQAGRGEAAADPAVAAIIAGMLRDREPSRSWAGRAMADLPIAAAFGCLVALQYFGILALHTALRAIGLAVFGFLVVGVAFAGLAQLFSRLFGRAARTDDELPLATAELVNLRKAIDTAPVRIARPLVVRGQPRVRGVLLTLGLIALMSLGSVVLLDAIGHEQGDIHRLLDAHMALGGGWGVAAVWVSWGRHLRHLPVRIDHRGVRFGLAPIIGWPDVLRISLVGPIPSDQDIKPAMIWSLRDRRDVRLDFGALGKPPEEILLAVRAYRPELVTAGSAPE